MKRLWLLSLLTLTLAITACGEEETTDAANNGATNNGATNNGATNNGDTNNGDTNNGDTNNGEEVTLVGTWLSEGDNVATLLAGEPFNIGSLKATFEANTYVVENTLKDGTVFMLEGAYTVTDAGGGFYTIALQQTAPTMLVSEGIFMIDTSTTPATMRYEVVQTEPDIGAAPPTVEAGFGSTNAGALGTANVQTYVRQ